MTESSSTSIEARLRKLLTQVRMKKIECANKSKYAADPEQSQNLLGWVDALIFVEKEIENCLSPK